VINGNNERIEMCMNDVVLENGFKENPNVQIETNRNLENGNEKIMKENLKKLHAQIKVSKPSENMVK
jgi:hypothetical protein